MPSWRCLLQLLLAASSCDFTLEPHLAPCADAVTIPVIASSGAGAPEHFSEVFQKTRAAAALAAGIFHRREVRGERGRCVLRNWWAGGPTVCACSIAVDSSAYLEALGWCTLG